MNCERANVKMPKLIAEIKIQKVKAKKAKQYKKENSNMRKQMEMLMEKLAAKKEMLKKINRSAAAAVITCVLIGALAVGGVSAYFTDGDSVTNTFTVGKISLDLQEPDWNPEAAKDITPNQTLAKNPQVFNDGANAEFVFLEVIVPYENVITANDDGTLNAAVDTELYSYTVNPGWYQMSRTQNAGNKTVTYLYVYGTVEACTELEVEGTTPALFHTVKFANVVEDQELEGEKLEIVVSAYGVQTSNINGGQTAPADVWMVLENQLPSTDK